MTSTVRRGIYCPLARLVFGKRLRVTPTIGSLPADSPFGAINPPASYSWAKAENFYDLKCAARDALLLTKHLQAMQANKHRRAEIEYAALAV